MSVLIYTGELDSANIQSSGADKAFLSRLEEIYDKVLRDKGCVTDLTKDIEISLTFLDSQKMREINNEYRNVDEPTDVLSFPLWESEDGLFTPPDDWEVLPIGDIMVCPEIVKKNAAENGGHICKRRCLLSRMVYCTSSAMTTILKNGKLQCGGSRTIW